MWLIFTNTDKVLLQSQAEYTSAYARSIFIVGNMTKLLTALNVLPCIAWGLPLATPSCQFYINCLHDVLTAALQTSVPVPRGLGLRQHKMRHCFVEWRAQRTSIHMLYT